MAPLRHVAALCALALAAACSEPPPPAKPAAAAPPAPPAAAAPAEPVKPAPAPQAPKPDPDKALAASVKKALDATARLNAQGVDVTASTGQVRLGGTVATAAERRLAGEVAAAVPGVSAVDNRLVVVAGS